VSNSANTICGIAHQISESAGITYLDDVQLSDGLLSGSIKTAAVVACSDMGAWVPFVCSSPNVQLFLFQNFGHHFDTAGVVETLVRARIENVVVYGHSDCEYTKFLAKSEQCLSTDKEERRRLYEGALQSDSEAVWKTVGQYNVLNELKKMLADPVVAPLTASGRLCIHGWFYDATIRQLEVFDPEQRAFMVVKK